MTAPQNAFAIASLIMALSSQAHATQIKDLAYKCSGTYQVQKAKPYFTAPPQYPTRAIPQAHGGAKEVIKILTLDACENLKALYGIHLSIGQSQEFSVGINDPTPESTKAFAQNEIGQIYPFQSTQHIGYAEDDGTLPLFPLVYEESLSILNLYGKANANQLYGTPDLDKLTPAQFIKVEKFLLEKIDYGIPLQKAPYSDASSWLNLFTQLPPPDEASALSYVGDLELVFSNSTKYTVSFVTLQVQSAIGYQFSRMLNQYDGVKWINKLQMLKTHPLLLDQQLVQWSDQTTKPALHLTGEQIEEFLSEALTQVGNLSKVNVYEAKVLQGQYQNAATTLSHQTLQANTIGALFEVSGKALALIQNILEIK